MSPLTSYTYVKKVQCKPYDYALHIVHDSWSAWQSYNLDLLLWWSPNLNLEEKSDSAWGKNLEVWQSLENYEDNDVDDSGCHDDTVNAWLCYFNNGGLDKYDMHEYDSDVLTWQRYDWEVKGVNWDDEHAQTWKLDYDMLTELRWTYR